MSTDPGAYAPECVETRTTSIVIGRALVDAVKFETSIAVWTHASGRTYRVNLRIGDELIEIDPERAPEAADLLQIIVDTIRVKGADAAELTRLETSAIALLDGRARTAAV